MSLIFVSISHMMVNRSKKMLLKYTYYGSLVKKKHQAIGDQYRKETVKQIC